MNGKEKHRIVLVDDHAIVREGLAIILDNQPDMTVIGECGDGEAAVELVGGLKPDLTIMDLQMPRMSGAVATIRIRERNPEARILLLTTYDGDEDIHRAMHAGARGYLLKESRKEEVLFAIREIMNGKRYLSPAVGASFAAAAFSQPLTARELEILKLVALGLANKEIATRLHISDGTVKSHINAIMQKMNVASRTEAALTAQRRGLLRE
jgi:DNA-binding NarL/FixJ family response regulator